MVLGALVIVIIGILIVNYFKDKGSTLTGVQTQSQTNTKQHEVVKGETLWSIAEDYYGSGYNWVDIKSANDLKTETIEVGQNLTMPDVSAKKPTVTKATTVVTAQTISGDTYTVTRGDNLWNIAVRAYGDGYKWVSIAKANSLKNPNVIHTGNVLTLPR